ncbi:MAG TPA: tetratricopeptide repeat protein, partial [Kofleriaceae bacterium]
MVRAATIAAMERISPPIARPGRRATGRSRAFARCWLVGCALIATLSSPARAEAQGDLAASLTALGAAYRAYDAGDLATAKTELARLPATFGAQGAQPGRRALAIRDYVLWLRGMVALRSGDPARAETAFRELGKLAGSPFARLVPWRLADCAWDRGDRAAAARAYQKLVAGKDALEDGDLGTAKYRIAETRSGDPQRAQLRALAIEHPSHPLALRAEQKLAELGAPALTPAERIERARHLTDAHLWDDAVAELSSIADPLPADVARQRDYWLGITLFKMRRRYGDAARLLLGVSSHPGQLGDGAAEAMFHGARALSRADRDDEAITWYRKVVATYPGSPYAQEAQFLSGWLEFNRGRYRNAIAPLETSLARYPRSKWVDDALWFLGMAHYVLGEWDKARARLEALARHRGALEG